MERKDDRQPQPLEDQLLDQFLAASSATDCTGLLPTAPVSQDEVESYNDLYPYLPEPVTPDGAEEMPKKG